VPPGLESLVLVLDTTKPIDHWIPIGKGTEKIDQKYFEKTDFTLGTFPIHVLERLLLPHTKDRQSARLTEGTVFYSLIWYMTNISNPPLKSIDIHLIGSSIQNRKHRRYPSIWSIHLFPIDFFFFPLPIYMQRWHEPGSYIAIRCL
jgi:hypothetical protein